MRTPVHHKEDLTLEKLERLPYLIGVLEEGLRIVSPSVVSLPRIVPADGISIDGFWVPGHVSLIHLFLSFLIAGLRHGGLFFIFIFVKCII